MINLETIPAEEQKAVLESFWTMLRECDDKCVKSRNAGYTDHMLMHWVRGWYQQWNRITGQNHVPDFDK